MSFRASSSLRACAPAATLELATRLMPMLGISRVTDITAMDFLGLPVFASIRPRGLALCVHAGKGMKAEEARVGALMEAVEFAVAEPRRTSWARQSWRLADLCETWAAELQLRQLAPRIDVLPTPEHTLDALACEDLAGGPAMWLPAELIFMPYGSEAALPLFGWSSNGLASGNGVDEATLHALLEILERDALAMHAVRDDSLWLPRGELPAEVQAMAALWQERGVHLAVRFLPNAFGLPCFRALLHEAGDAVVSLTAGSGLHFDPCIALTRAVCEAAQSRLSHIHGGRDDITQFYATHGDDKPQAIAAHETLAFREAFDTTRKITWAALPAVPCEGRSLKDLLGGLIKRLSALGFKQVLRHRFSIDLGGLQVVKLVVPGCESVEHALDRMGPRLYERLRAVND